MKLLRLFAFAALAFCTASCKDLTHVQTGYISDRSDCQSRASYGLSTYVAGASGISARDRSSMQSQLFCECMKDREWNVAGCKYRDTAIAKVMPAPQEQQPTIVVVQQAPPAAAAAPAAVEPLACPAPPKGKKRAKRKLDGTCPAPEEYSQTELDNVLNKE